jgi:hypothetical protein
MEREKRESVFCLLENHATGTYKTKTRGSVCVRVFIAVLSFPHPDCCSLMRESWVQGRHQHAPVVGSLFAARVGLEAVPS